MDSILSSDQSETTMSIPRAILSKLVLSSGESFKQLLLIAICIDLAAFEHLFKLLFKVVLNTFVVIVYTVVSFSEFFIYSFFSHLY